MSQGNLIVSLDFELFWGMLDVVPLEQYRGNILGVRTAVPRLLELFARYGIHATWATVGFQFAQDARELERFLPDCRPGYRSPKLQGYAEAQGLPRQERDCFFAPELIAQIAAAPGQELGSHTFCHYYCREPGQTTAQFRADVLAALAIAREKGYSLKSMVLPRNQSEPDYVAVLRELGFESYRDEENDWIHEKIRFRPLLRLLRLLDVYLPLTGQGGFRPADEGGIVNLTGSRMYKPYFPPLFFLEWLKLWRIKAQLRHAARNGLTFHLWWHPHNIGIRQDLHLRQLENIFRYYARLRSRYGMESLTMEEAASKVLKKAPNAEEN